MKPLSQRLTNRELIQRGDLTLAFRARDTVLDRPVFVKCLHPALAQDSEIRARFEREAKAVARLDHSNLVRIYEYGEDPDEGLYMLLEWLEGTTLAARIAEGKHYAGDEFTDLALQLLKGLSALHSVGILHRDLKPENILVTEKAGDSGESPPRTHFKITDFSLAALRDAPRLTHHEAIVGTPAYMSPEQAAGGAPDETSDLFSLGVVLYEAATGERPFAARTMIETLKNVRELEPSFKQPAIVALPEKARELLFKLLQKDSSVRPSSANEARRLLGESVAINDQPAARSLRLHRFLPWVAVLLGFWVLRRWFPGNAQLLNYALLFMVVGGFIIARSPLRHAKPEHLHPRNRKRDLTYFSAAIVVVALWAGMMLWYPWTGNDAGKTQIPNPKSQIPSTTVDTVQSQNEMPEIVQQNPKVLIANPKTASNPVEPEFRPAPESKTVGGRILKNEGTVPAGPVIQLSETKIDSVDLLLTTEPWAQVFLSGVQLGTTPLSGTLRVPAGNQTLVLRNPAFPPVQVRLNLTESKARADVKLAEYAALVHVNVEPWGELYLDGEHVGTTPLPNPLFVSPGHHSVRVSHPKLRAVQQEFQTSAGETLAVNVDLARGQAVVKK